MDGCRTTTATQSTAHRMYLLVPNHQATARPVLCSLPMRSRCIRAMCPLQPQPRFPRLLLLRRHQQVVPTLLLTQDTPVRSRRAGESARSSSWSATAARHASIVRLDAGKRAPQWRMLAYSSCEMVLGGGAGGGERGNAGCGSCTCLLITTGPRIVY
jgi:hypothetical protein